MVASIAGDRSSGEAAPMPRADGTPSPVLLVDDHEAVRAGLGALLREELASPDLIAVGGVGAALEAAERDGPELAIIDYRLPDGDGLSLCLRLKCAPRAPAVLIYSAFADGQLAVLGGVAGGGGGGGAPPPAPPPDGARTRGAGLRRGGPADPRDAPPPHPAGGDR